MPITEAAVRATLAGARRVRRIVASGLAIAIVAVTLLALLLWVAEGMRPMPVTYGRSALGVLGLIFAPICYAAIGWLLATRVSGNPIGWLFLVAGAAVSSMLPVNLAVAGALEALRPASAGVIVAAWGRTVFSVPVMLSVLITAALIFPNGRPLPGLWRLGPWTALAAGALLALATALDPRGLATYPAIPNPTALPYGWIPWVTILRVTAVALAVASLAAAVGSLWTRYRTGDAVSRAQLRWIILGVGIAAVLVVPYLAVRYVTVVGNELGEFLAAAAQLGSCAFPVTAAFAISRYRLYEVDMLIGRTLVYLPLSAALGGLYTGGIALFQRIFVAVTGETSDVAIVMTILLVATAFTPMRKWLESVVERRFPAQAAPQPAAMPEPGQTISGRRARADAAEVSMAVTPTAATSIAMARLVSVEPSGNVACPLGVERNLAYCLTCPDFVAVARQPSLTVVCEAPVA
jgi:hypothetical protein